MSLIAYTSMVRADTATSILAGTHRVTEEYLRERDVPTCCCATTGTWRTTPPNCP
ncbi:hypothetical protein NKH77_00175 [Streptomyces sp. M19]